MNAAFRFVSRRLRLRPLVAGVLALLPATLAFADEAPAPREITVLAGPKDHRWSGRHNCEKDLPVPAGSLTHAANLPGVITKLHVGTAPRDLAYEEVADWLLNRVTANRR